MRESSHQEGHQDTLFERTPFKAHSEIFTPNHERLQKITPLAINNDKQHHLTTGFRARLAHLKRESTGKLERGTRPAAQFLTGVLFVLVLFGGLFLFIQGGIKTAGGIALLAGLVWAAHYFTKED